MVVYRQYRREEDACSAGQAICILALLCGVLACVCIAIVNGARKDNALCVELLHKLVDNWENVFQCKLNLADQCDGVMKQELHAQNKLQDHYMDRLNTLAQAGHPHGVQELTQNVTKFIDYHQTTLVDICGFNVKCTKCLRESVDLWNKRNYTCTSANAWKVIQYSPNKEN